MAEQPEISIKEVVKTEPVKVDSVAQVDRALEALYDHVSEIPFGQSATQNRAFVIGAEMSGARAIRTAALNLQSKLRDLRAYRINCKRAEIKKKQLELKIKSAEDGFDKELLQLDLEELLGGEIGKDKMLNDLLHEIRTLAVAVFNSKKISRDEFEANEIQAYASRFLKQVHTNDNVFGLGILAKIAKGEDAYALLASGKGVEDVQKYLQEVVSGGAVITQNAGAEMERTAGAMLSEGKAVLLKDLVQTSQDAIGLVKALEGDSEPAKLLADPLPSDTPPAASDATASPVAPESAAG